MKNSPGVDLNLPLKTDVLLYVPLTPLQRAWYTRLLTRADQSLLDNIFSGAKDKEQSELKQESALQGWESKTIDDIEQMEQAGVVDEEFEESKAVMAQSLAQTQGDTTTKSAWLKLMNLLMQLRKCCNHPYLLGPPIAPPWFLELECWLISL